MHDATFDPGPPRFAHHHHRKPLTREELINLAALARVAAGGMRLADDGSYHDDFTPPGRLLIFGDLLFDSLRRVGLITTTARVGASTTTKLALTDTGEAQRRELLTRLAEAPLAPTAAGLTPSCSTTP